MHRSPEAIAIMLAALALYGWVVVDLPPLQRVGAILAASGIFLLAVFALEKLRDRYGVDLDAESGQ